MTTIILSEARTHLDWLDLSVNQLASRLKDPTTTEIELVSAARNAWHEAERTLATLRRVSAHYDDSSKVSKAFIRRKAAFREYRACPPADKAQKEVLRIRYQRAVRRHLRHIADLKCGGRNA